MNDSNHDFGTTLAARFRREHTHVPAEPFVRVTLQRVAAERVRLRVVKYTQLGAALIILAWASPWLIEASVLLSNQLDGLFATPLGMIAAALAVTISAALLRMRTHR
jgi:hypothetical protein